MTVSFKDFLDPCTWLCFALIGFACSLYRHRARRTACALWALALIMPIAEFARWPAHLLARLERPYWAPVSPLPPLDHTRADAVVMCGGLLSPSAADFSSANYSGEVDRFLRAVDLARSFGKPLVLGGGQAGGADTPLESHYERAWLQAWSLTNLVIHDLGSCRNTHDEALATAQLARTHGWRRVLLVSSAGHLKRASATFRATGLEVTPVGCDFVAVAQVESRRRRLLPSTASLEKLRLYLSESLGYEYYLLRGWIGPSP